MKKYFVEFLKRGLLFGGFGPIVAGIVFLILNFSVENFSLTGIETFLAIISTYLLAFIVAGASIFNQIESWSTVKSLLIHMSVIYVTYLVCYLINTWIPFDYISVLIFTGIFLLTYLIIYFSIYFSIKSLEKKLNKKLSKTF